MQHIRVGSFFSGLGAFEKALERLGIPHEIVFYCEIDKYASQSFSLIHNVPESLNLWDITKVDETKLPDFDLMTWGFPCQDISVAGKQAGVIEGETRSGLYYDGIRILRHKKPKYSIIENVKNLTSEAFRPVFYLILCDLEDAGYKSYWQVLNAKDYGVPQNRERVFIVSIRNDIEQDFDFPTGFDNGIRLKDLLEDEVVEKYYISQEKTEKLMSQLKDNSYMEYSNAITSNYANSLANDEIRKQRRQVVVSFINPVALTETRTEESKKIRQESMKKGRDFSPRRGKELKPREDGMSNCITATPSKEHLLFGILINRGQVKGKDDDICSCIDASYHKGLDNHASRTGILVKEATKQGFALAYEGDSINIQFPDSKTRRGRVGQGVAQTIETSCNQATLMANYRIRKLTPKECFRLMDFDDADWQVLVDNGVSDSQLYKMAGNSIVVKVLEKIMENLFTDNAVSCTKQLALFG